MLTETTPSSRASNEKPGSLAHHAAEPHENTLLPREPEVVGHHAATAVLQVAERLYAMQPEWVVFFHEVLGVNGIVRRTFSDPASLVRFECSPQYARIRELIDALRNRQRSETQDENSPRISQRIVTVRMPKEVHETLKAEASQMRVSVNTLCISKLINLLDGKKRAELSTRSRGENNSETEDTAADPFSSNALPRQRIRKKK